MGCSSRVKASEIRADQRWDFIVGTPVDSVGMNGG